MEDKELKILFQNLEQPRYDSSFDKVLIEKMHYAYLQRRKQEERLSILWVALIVFLLLGVFFLVDHFVFNFLDKVFLSFKNLFDNILETYNKLCIKGITSGGHESWFWMMFGSGMIGMVLLIANYYFVRYLNEKKNRKC